MALHQVARRLRFEPSKASPLAEPIDLDELLDEFLAGYRYNPGSVRTLKHYEMYLGRQWMPWLATIHVERLDQVEPKHIERYLAEITGRLAPVSVRKIYNQIHRFFEWCCERLYAHWNPCDVIKAPRVPDGTRQGFEPEQVARMNTVTNRRPGKTGTRDRAILGVLLDTGARASELVGMGLDEVDYTRHRVLLHGKGQKDRWVPIGQETQRKIRVWVRVRARVPSNRLWLTQRNGDFSYSTLVANLALLGGYAGVEDCTPHRFRHTFAVAHYLAHHDLIALQSLLGHASVEMTMRYLRQLGVSYGAEMNYRPPGEWLLAND